MEEVTAQELEHQLRARLPDPTKVASLADARERINVLNSLVIAARQDLLNVTKSMKLTVDLLEKERAITKDLTIRMLVNSKDALYGAYGSFNAGMQNMTFSMKQIIASNDAVQKLLIPLVRTFTTHQFGCSDGKVYMCLQPENGFLGEWEYGLEISLDATGIEKFIEWMPLIAEDLPAAIEWIKKLLPVIDQAMRRFIIANPEEDDVEKAKNLLTQSPEL